MLWQQRNQVTIVRSPLLDCLKSADLLAGVSMSDSTVGAAIGVIEGEADLSQQRAWNGACYRELPPQKLDRHTVTLIPYLAWADGGVSEMTVWVPRHH